MCFGLMRKQGDAKACVHDSVGNKNNNKKVEWQLMAYVWWMHSKTSPAYFKINTLFGMGS